MNVYYRPIAQTNMAPGRDALKIAGGWCWFHSLQRIERGGRRENVPVGEVPGDIIDAIISPRPEFAGLPMDKPKLMGILNVTPDSFSDGGKFDAPETAVFHATEMIKNGADIIDVGGESTRPGADLVPADLEITRIRPVIAGIRKHGEVPISIDTRKAAVARAAIDAGAGIVNDVSALKYDPQLSEIISKNNIPVCLMHATGDPKTMQEKPVYDDVLLDVFDYLRARIRFAVAAGISAGNIIIDPGIGFGKTVEHNLALLQGLGLFHTLGCPILLGASRKKFIDTLGHAPNVAERMPGSVAVTLAAVAQGVQIHRVHDIKETRQALTLWAAATGTGQE